MLAGGLGDPCLSGFPDTLVCGQGFSILLVPCFVSTPES
jgi:hypothetical protein